MTTATGQAAEAAVAHWLGCSGFDIIDRNWRTRWCEIDIVAKKTDTVYLVEVKFRQTSSQGDGLDYITTSKLRQMRFAAEHWCNENNWTGDCELAAIQVSGERYDIGPLIICD